MTDDSKFVLRWEIDNAIAKFATGRVESGVFDKGGFKWTMIAEKDVDRDDEANYTLKCDAAQNGEWKCEVEAEVRQYYADRINRYVECTEQRFCFNPNNNCWIYETEYSWDDMTLEHFIYNDQVILEIRIKIISSERGKVIADPAIFASPNRMSNVILKIGDERLYVSKEYLSVQSPVFEALFFGEFTEKGKEEVELKDVVYEEFVDLLQLVYQITMKLTDRTVVHILKLSDRFQMENMLSHAKLYLTQSTGIDVISKLLLADQYNLVDLKVHFLQSFDNATELLKKMLAFPEYDKFSSDMKAAVFDRIKELKLQ